MGILETVVFVAAISNLLLGILVFIKDPSKRVNRLFGFSCFITAIWVFVNFMMGIQPTIFWLKSASAFGALVPASVLLWFLDFCEKKIAKFKIILIWGLGLLFFIISYGNNLIVTNVKRVYLGGFEGELGPFYIYWVAYMTGMLFLLIYVLISGYYKAEGVKKIQLRYVLIGAILYISVVLVASFILPFFGNLRFAALDSPSSFLLLVFTAIAITRHYLFEIRVILTEFLVGVISLVLLGQALVAPTFNLKIFGFFLLFLFGIVGYFLIQSVIREIELRAKLEVLYGELKKLDDAKSEFISIASHQLRTPLTAVKGYVSMILENSYGDVPHDMNQPLKNVYASNERLIGLVNEILNISKIEAGKMEMNLENTSLEEMILDVINELRIKADAKKLYLTYIKPTVPIPLVTLDKTKIRQIVMNLIDNSIKYTEKGGTTVRLSKLDSKVRVEISDTGIGLEKDDILKLFESFSRVKAASRTRAEGTGLGLYIARKYVEMHQGRIWVESKGKGKGSVFYIELPIK